MLSPEEIQSKRTDLQNDVYAAVFPAFVDIETRGQNAHQGAQVICMDVGKKFVRRLSPEEIASYVDKYGELD